MRFRKSIKVGKNTRINLSKSGVGISSGVRGARVSVNSKGTRTTLSAPGTGISYSTYKSHGSSNRNNNQSIDNSKDKINYVQSSNYSPVFPKGKYYSMTLIVLMLLNFLLFSAAKIPISPVFLVISIWLIVKFRANTNKAYKYYNKALKTKDNEKRMELLKTAKEIDNSNDLVNYYLAYDSFENRDSKKTLEYIGDMGSCKNIDVQELKRIYILSLFDNNEYQKVINELEHNVDTDLSSRLIVALSYKNLGYVKKASEILAAGPVNKRTYDDTVLTFKYELGLCYLELGDKTKAKRQLQKVYEIDSSFEDISKYAQELGFALGEHTQ